MGDEEPLAVAVNENINRLHGGFVEAIGECAGDAGGAGNPSDIVFDADKNSADGNADALDIFENARPAVADFVPSEQKFPSRLNALNAIIMGPDGLHFAKVQGLECRIEAVIRRANSILRGLFFANGARGHGGFGRCETGVGNAPRRDRADFALGWPGAELYLMLR